MGFIHCSPVEVAANCGRHCKTALLLFTDELMEQDALQGRPDSIGELYRRSNFGVRRPDPSQDPGYLTMWKNTNHAKVPDVTIYRGNTRSGYSFWSRRQTVTLDALLIYRSRAWSLDSHEMFFLTNSLQGTIQEVAYVYSVIVMGGCMVENMSPTADHLRTLGRMLNEALVASTPSHLLIGYAAEDWCGASPIDIQSMASACERLSEDRWDWLFSDEVD